MPWETDVIEPERDFDDEQSKESIEIQDEKRDLCYLGYDDCYKYGQLLKYEDYKFKNRTMAMVMSIYWIGPLSAYFTVFYPWGNQEYIDLMNTKHTFYKNLWQYFVATHLLMFLPFTLIWLQLTTKSEIDWTQ